LRLLRSPEAARPVALALSGAMFLGVFALSLAGSHHGLLHLHAVPIAIFALQIGLLAGLSATACSLSLMALWAEVEGAELLMFDYLSGAVPFLVVVGLCQAMLGRARGGGASPATAPAPAGRQLETSNVAAVDELTDREREVLGLLALGHTNREIAEQLVLSVRTVESHRARIQRKLAITSRAELVKHAVDRDLLRFAPPAA
jgi:DNA-binding CsgD family transcriptional regulator